MLHSAQSLFQLPMRTRVALKALVFILPVGGNHCTSGSVFSAYQADTGCTQSTGVYPSRGGQPLHFGQCLFSLPSGHGLHSAQSLFTFPWEHRFRGIKHGQSPSTASLHRSHAPPAPPYAHTCARWNDAKLLSFLRIVIGGFRCSFKKSSQLFIVPLTRIRSRISDRTSSEVRTSPSSDLHPNHPSSSLHAYHIAPATTHSAFP